MPGAPHVVLIRPPLVHPIAQKRGNFGMPPLGLAYLAAALRRADVAVTGIDAYGEDPGRSRLLGSSLIVRGLDKDDIASRVPPDASIIGVSCMFTNEWIYCREVLGSIRARFPSALIVVGGEHPTADPDSCFSDSPEIDAIVRGEGEETIVELVAAWRREGDLSRVRGLALRRDRSIARTAPRARIQDLDTIPWPDWAAFPVDTYLDRGFALTVKGKRALPLLASRGCPYECTFCSSPEMWGTRWSARDPSDVVREIESYVRRYRLEHFYFVDLTAIIRESWIREFCERLIARNLGVTWGLPSGTRSEALTADVLGLLRRSGCTHLTYAPESASDATLRRIRKRIRLPEMQRSMRASVRAGIVTRANIIIGFPGQTRREVLADFPFVAKLAVLGVHDLACFAFVPYPGSELHGELVRDGKLDKGSPSYGWMMAHNVVNNPNVIRSWNAMSRMEIRGAIWTLGALFYGVQFMLRPWRLLRTVRRLLSGTSVTGLESILLNMLHDQWTALRLSGVARWGRPHSARLDRRLAGTVETR